MTRVHRKSGMLREGGEGRFGGGEEGGVWRRAVVWAGGDL